MANKTIILTGEQVEILYNHGEGFYEGEDEKNIEHVKGFEGWTVSADPDTGEYDGSKGAMVDFDICLYDEKGNFRGSTNDGYYVQGDFHWNGNGPNGCFVFNVPKPKSKEEEIFDEFINVVQNIADEPKSPKMTLKTLKSAIKRYETRKELLADHKANKK